MAVSGHPGPHCPGDSLSWQGVALLTWWLKTWVTEWVLALFPPRQVTFQTPLRDPQTHRILSPSMSSNLEAYSALGNSDGLDSSLPGRTPKT